jgi:hypothetical protein
MKHARRYFWMFAAALVLSGCDCCDMPFFSCPPDDPPVVDYRSTASAGGFELTWDQANADLDLFVIDSAGAVAYSDSPHITAGWLGPDVTDSIGYGPEYFTVSNHGSGSLRVKVNYHWHYGQANDVTATVKIFKNGFVDNSVGPFTHVFHKVEANGDTTSNPPGAWAVPGTFPF